MSCLELDTYIVDVVAIFRILLLYSYLHWLYIMLCISSHTDPFWKGVGVRITCWSLTPCFAGIRGSTGDGVRGG